MKTKILALSVAMMCLCAVTILTANPAQATSNHVELMGADITAVRHSAQHQVPSLLPAHVDITKSATHIGKCLLFYMRGCWYCTSIPSCLLIQTLEQIDVCQGHLAYQERGSQSTLFISLLPFPYLLVLCALL